MKTPRSKLETIEFDTVLTSPDGHGSHVVGARMSRCDIDVPENVGGP
jgi:hypothetical protein